MKCPQCNNSGSSEAKFCFACGHKLGVDCLVCETVNPQTRTLCISCGRPLPKPTTVQVDDPLSDAVLSDAPDTDKTIAPCYPTEGERKSGQRIYRSI